MKCKLPKRKRERQRRWRKKAWKNLFSSKSKVQKPIVSPEPKKISWFRRLIIWIKRILKGFKGRK